jgi:hypothetical protein
MTATTASRTFTIHVIDGAGPDMHSTLRRMLGKKLGIAGLVVEGFDTPDQYFNTVPVSAERPDVYVIGNWHPRMTGLTLANKLREGFTGKIFIYTGGLKPEQTPDVDGVFEKAFDERRLVAALSAAFAA